jgi:hypothetical protein
MLKEFSFFPPVPGPCVQGVAPLVRGDVPDHFRIIRAFFVR